MRLALDLYALDYFETTAQTMSALCPIATCDQERTSCRMCSRGGDTSCVSEKFVVLRVRNVDRPLG